MSSEIDYTIHFSSLFFFATTLKEDRQHQIAKWYHSLSSEEQSMIEDLRYESSAQTEFDLGDGV